VLPVLITVIGAAVSVVAIAALVIVVVAIAVGAGALVMVAAVVRAIALVSVTAEDTVDQATEARATPFAAVAVALEEIIEEIEGHEKTSCGPGRDRPHPRMEWRQGLTRRGGQSLALRAAPAVPGVLTTLIRPGDGAWVTPLVPFQDRSAATHRQMPMRNAVVAAPRPAKASARLGAAP